MIRRDWGPSVQIFEIDRSQYSRSMTGTRVLVFGFAAKGEDYETHEITSIMSFLNTFGEPTNEAERYFYNACKEIIQQNGILYACKLPYKNDAHDRYVVQEYKLDTQVKEISSIANLAEQFSCFIDGNWTRFDYTIKGDSTDAESFRDINNLYQEVVRFNNAADARALAVPFYYLQNVGLLEIEGTEEDNWIQLPVAKIYKKLKALFGFDAISVDTITDEVVHTSNLYKALAETEISGLTSEWFPRNANIVSVDFTPIDNYIVVNGLSSGNTVKDRILAFHEMYLNAFGPEETDIFKNVSNPAYQPSLKTIAHDFGDRWENSELKEFLDLNMDFFNQFRELDLENDAKYFGGEVPYVFVDDGHFNLGPYFLVSKLADKLDDAESILNSDGVIIMMTKLLNLNRYLVSQNITNLSGPLTYFNDNFADLNNKQIIAALLVPETEEVEYVDPKTGETKTKTVKVSVNDRICAIKDAFTEIMNLPEYASINARLNSGIYSPTKFARKAIEYYMNHTVIYGNNDKNRIQNAKDLNVFEQTMSDDPNAELENVTFFEKYNGPSSSAPELKSVLDLIAATLKEVTLEELCDYSVEIHNYEVEDEEHPMLAWWIDNKQDVFKQYPYKDLFALFNADYLVKNFSFGAIKRIDNSVDKYLTLRPNGRPHTITINDLDGYSTGEQKVRQNTVMIVDKTRGTYAKSVTGKSKDVIGILPVITTAANALHYQNMLEDSNSSVALNYQAVGNIRNLDSYGLTDDEATQAVYDIKAENGNGILDNETAIPFMSGDRMVTTVSTTAAENFPVITFKEDGVLDRENLKKIGVVVFKMFVSPTTGNKIDYEPVEAYVGELDPDAKNPATKVSTFIDTLVNSQSEYIELYSNCLATQATKKAYQDEADILILEPGVNEKIIYAGTLGFYDQMTKKDISLTDSILKPLDKIWTNNSDVNEKDIDIVVDAGISNIAQFIKSVYGDVGKGEYDPASVEASVFKLKNEESVKTWRSVIAKYDNFCKNIRRDCMFICDGPRPFCLVGNKKIVRKSKPSNTIDGNLLPNLRYMGGLNTSYGAGYCDWFEMTDDYSGNEFWCPPSIKASGIYIYTDSNAQFWDAPAGLNRGVVNGATDVAFSPTLVQSGQIYNKTWNYAINYPNEGIILEGQKTLQQKPSALDRVNVRRLCLRLERFVYKTSRWFLYELNNTLTRQRLYDALNAEFKRVKGLGGIEDYRIICDETVNTDEVINNNELRVRIGIIPVKVAEWILVEFVVSKRGQSWEEAFAGLG